jgi:hypothetical protein
VVSVYGPFCTIVETREFSDRARAVFSALEIDDLFEFLSTHPDAGVVVQGGGGVRKLRWGRGGQGKQGGARVIYFHRRANMTVTLLSAYAKNRKSDLTAIEKAAMRKAVEELER